MKRSKPPKRRRVRRSNIVLAKIEVEVILEAVGEQIMEAIVCFPAALVVVEVLL